MWVCYHFNVYFWLFLFANDLLLAVYFVFILDYGKDVRQNTNSSNFLTSSKWVVRQWGQIVTSTTHLAQELLTNVQWWFKKFCKGVESLEDEENSGWPLEVDNDQFRGSSNLILLQLHKKLPKNSLWSFNICSKLER